MQNLDVYSKKKLVKIFNFMRVLLSYKTFSIFFFLILKFFFFIQFMMLTIVNINDSKDHYITILKYISKVIFIQEIVTDKQSYEIALILNSILTFITIACIIYLIISIKIGRFYMKFPIFFLNLVNVTVMQYLIGPIVQISLMSITCKNKKHIFLEYECFKDFKHLFAVIASVINLIFFLVFSVSLSIYYNEVGAINENKVGIRINCNYEVYMNISKILMFILAYFIKYHCSDKKIYKVILQAYIFFNTLFLVIYVYKIVLYYDERIYLMTQFGWTFVCWSDFCILMKTLLNINDTTIFHLVGWVILGISLYLLEEYRREYLLTDFNIFEAKSLKEIELFNLTLFNLMNQRSVKSKTLLIGIIKKFEEYVKNSPELNDEFNKLCSNEHLKKKFNSTSALPILSIIYIIYDHHLEKSLLKNDIVINMCYFLMNKVKNPTFSIALCSKMKVTSHKHLYFKYILMEEIKEYLVNKLSKSNNKESIKHVQIGSVILYNIYMELFKIKIYDAACNQIDYFDILKNNVSTPKTTENFLKIGEDILRLRKEILKLWEKIVELNPFSDESEKDYMLYLQTILQDDVLARTESKKYSTLKTNKLSERNNIYHSMFIQELSSIILIDGYQSNGKILYTTPNFPALFLFSGKEILNMSIDDLLPNVIQTFHKDLIEDAIKFTNLNYVFKSQKDLLLKGKNGGLFNVRIYIKCIPNLSYGLIYTVYITKIQDHNFILILDKDFKINGFTEMQSGISFTMNNNYGLTQGLYNHHIALVLPEILLQMEYKDQKFYIPKSELELKGNLYPVSVWKELDNKVELVLDKIKQCGKLQNDDEQKNTVQEYDDLIKDVSTKYQKPFSVFYKIITKSFLDGKYFYHRVYITNDLIALNENSKSFPSQIGSNTGKNDLKKTELKMSNIDVKDNSEKQIKLKVGSLSEKEKEIEEEKKEENEKKEDEKKKSNLQNDFSKPSSAPSSIVTKSSIDSAGFNKLKNGILEKKEISAIRFMKYLCFIFGIATIGFICLDSYRVRSNFTDLTEYLTENLYFNHTKIAVSCVYLSTLNLKWIKDNFTQDSFCHTNNNCTEFYSFLLNSCITDIKSQKENASYFYEDFKDILSYSKKIYLELFNLSSHDTLTIDIDNLLNLLISNGLKLNANIDTYYSNIYNLYDVNSDNLLNQSLNFVNDEAISGFNDSEKKTKINKNFKLIPISLICISVIFGILTGCFSYLIFRLNDMEKFFLDKLIKFRSTSFDSYLKRLEDLKKKLRNDSGEEEEKANENIEMNEIGSKKSKKDEDEEKDKKNKKKEEKDDINKKKMKRKNGSKANKIQQQRNKKKKTMAKFFFIYNLLFTLKVMLILIISITYYIVVMLVEAKQKNSYLSFDSTTNSIEGIYRSSFDIFLRLKTELAPFEDYLSNYKNCNSNETCINKLVKYEMNIPTNDEISTPKLGSLLMPLVNNLNSASQSTKDLNNLYNSDACQILFPDDENEYDICSNFWSSILVKGMEQSITQMSVIINTVIDELNSLKNGNKEFEELIDPSSSFSQYELFVEYYLFKSYMKTVNIFYDFRVSKLNSTKKIFYGILYGYIAGAIVLFFILLCFVYSSKYVFNSFLNFIGILPVKYLIEDDILYKDILKLEQHIF